MLHPSQARQRLFGGTAVRPSVSPRDHPDYDTGYREWHALVSNGYIRRYYRHQAAESASLRTLPAEIIGKLTANDIDRISAKRKVGLVVIFILVGIYFVSKAAILYAAPLLLALELYLLWKLNRGHHIGYAADRLFTAIRSLERNSKFWTNDEFRWNHAADLEGVARDLERIPLALNGIAPGVRREVLKTSQAKAQGVRNLEVRVIKTEEFTNNDMIKRLMQDMNTILEGRWHELPEAPYERQASRWSLILQLCLIFAFIGGAIALIALYPRIASAVSGLAALLAGVTVLLKKSDIVNGIAKWYLNIASGMESKQS